MNKFILLLMLVVFVSASENEEVFVTKKVYTDISKNAVFDAAKTLFTLSNEDNGNKDFIIDAYRDKLEVNRVMFKNNIIKIYIVLDKWSLELYQIDSETRAILTLIRSDGINQEDTEEINENVHELFWDRLDYLLGLKKDWKICSSYFNFIPFNKFCNNYFINSVPENKYIQKDILIAKENIKINTIDTVKADIFEKTDLTLAKSNNDIFNQSENIEDTNMLNPITTDDIFQTEAQKKERVKKAQEESSEGENIGIEDLKEEELLDIDKQMNKFKEDLENIINMKPQIDDTDSAKIILDSETLKENSEFDLKSKEKN